MEVDITDYMFLSREIPLPLSALKIINERISFSEILNFSPTKFENLLLNMNKFEKVVIRNIDKKVNNFIYKSSNETYEKIKYNLKICKENNIKVLSFFDEDFPPNLRSIKQPPKLVFIKGSIKKRDKKAIAIIGTREPTEYGREMASKIAERFSELGFTIVSGFARGIDTIAMKSALESNGRVIGVIASGILNLYPPENKPLISKLVKNGALISERFPLKNVNVRALQLRNRITSGFGLANIFVEGTQSSGTKWQFKFGSQQGKIPVGVVPKDNDCKQAYIPNWIINKKGGLQLSTIDDVDKIAEIILNQEKGDYPDAKDDESELKQTTIYKYGSK